MLLCIPESVQYILIMYHISSFKRRMQNFYNFFFVLRRHNTERLVCICIIVINCLNDYCEVLCNYEFAICNTYSHLLRHHRCLKEEYFKFSFNCLNDFCEIICYYEFTIRNDDPLLLNINFSWRRNILSSVYWQSIPVQ